MAARDNGQETCPRAVVALAAAVLGMHPRCMLRKTVVGSLMLIPLGACFSPDAPEETGAEGGESEVSTGTSAGEATTATTGGPTMTGTSTGEETTAPSTTAGDSGSESGADTETGSETGEVPVTCGNGEPDEGEDCDDGNEMNGDGCNNDCVESGVVVWDDLYDAGAMEATGLAINDDAEIMVLGNSRESGDVYYSDWRRLYAGNGDIVATGATGGFDTSRLAASGDDWVIVHLVEPDTAAGDQDPLSHEVPGNYAIARVDNLFNDEWSTELANTREIGAISARDGGGLLISGSVLNTANAFQYEHDGFLAAYSNGGSLDWERLDPDDGSPRDCHPSAAFSNGSSVVGCVDSGRAVTVRRHHADGTLAAESPLGVVNQASEWIDYWSTDRTYPSMAAGSDGQSAVAIGERVFALAQNGDVEWDETFQDTGDEQFFSAAFDGSGALILGGRRQSASGSDGLDGVIVKVAPDGTPLWTHVVEGSDDDEVRGIAVTPADRVAFCATVGHDTTSPELLVAVLTP